jgi:hypothetical protein
MTSDAGGAAAATDLKRDHHTLADPQTGHRISERNDLGHGFMAEREGRLVGTRADDQKRIYLAAGDRERAHQRLAVAL